MYTYDIPKSEEKRGGWPDELTGTGDCLSFFKSFLEIRDCLTDQTLLRISSDIETIAIIYGIRDETECGSRERFDN